MKIINFQREKNLTKKRKFRIYKGKKLNTKGEIYRRKKNPRVEKDQLPGEIFENKIVMAIFFKEFRKIREKNTNDKKLTL